MRSVPLPRQRPCLFVVWSEEGHHVIYEVYQDLRVRLQHHCVAAWEEEDEQEEERKGVLEEID